MTSMTDVAPTVCLFILAVHFSDAYIWTYTLSQPADATGDAYASQDLHPRNVQPSPNAASRRRDNNTKPWQACRSDRSCGKGMFCDRHYGTCEQHRQLGQPCRRHGHCSRELECVYGRCRSIVPLPEIGSLCRHDWECGHGRCCARRHGEAICQALLAENDSCYVPTGGLPYSLNQRCPCGQGLVCKNTATNHSQGEMRPWHIVDSLHCAQP